MAKAKRSRRPKKLNKVPMGLAAVAKAAYTAYKIASPIAKHIYRIPAVQKKWKGFKDRHQLNWLPFGPNHPMNKNVVKNGSLHYGLPAYKKDIYKHHGLRNLKHYMKGVMTV